MEGINLSEVIQQIIEGTDIGVPAEVQDGDEYILISIS